MDTLNDVEVALWLPQNDLLGRWLDMMKHPEWTDVDLERKALVALAETRRALHMVDTCSMDAITRRVLRTMPREVE